jgi:hypothetical protein
MFDEREVLSALIDREPADADVLERVLEVPANRALLVDMVRLRARVVGEDDMQPPERLTFSVPMAPRRPRTPTWTKVAAAVLLGIVSAGGGMWAERHLSRDRPPTPSRTVVMDLVSTNGGAR